MLFAFSISAYRIK